MASRPKAPAYDPQPGTLRPFRVFDERTQKQMIGCNFAYHDNAIECAAKRMIWVKAGTTLSIIDITKAHRLIGQFTLKRSGEIVPWIHPDWHFQRPRNGK